MPLPAQPRPSDAGIAIGPVEAIVKKTHPAVILAGDQAVAVVLDFVNPLRADGRLRCSGRIQGSIMPSRFAGGLVRQSMSRPPTLGLQLQNGSTDRDFDTVFATVACEQPRS
jgi:hypothetical protein